MKIRLTRVLEAHAHPLLIALLAVPAAPAAAQSEEPSVEEVVVVGSRIQRPDYRFSNPVLSLDAEDIQHSGTTSMTDFLKDFPALQGSFDSNDTVRTDSEGGSFIGSTGLALLDLRNLGFDRTLVLQDGRRHVASLPGSAAVDIDTIPIELIERVEILTGGASAIYGADGVSGVVNFVTKRDFQGLRLRTQLGQDAQSDRDSQLISLTAGTGIAEDRGNLAVAIEYSREGRLKGVERDFAAGGDRLFFVRNPFADSPDEIPLPDIRYFDSSRNGAVDVDGDFVQDFDGDDTPWDAGTIPFIEPFNQQGGDGTRLDDYVGDLYPEEERVTMNVLFNFEFAPAVNLFAELKYSENEAFSRSQPTFDFFLALEPDYAYLSPAISAAVADAVADGVYADAGVPGPMVSRDHFDLGVRGEDIDRETFRGVIGLDGDISDHLRYEISYVYGETDVANHVLNNRYNDRFAAALDAVVDPDTGDVVCRSSLDPTAEPVNLDWSGFAEFTPRPGTWAGSFTPGPDSGCVPVNILGEGSVSDAARDWIMLQSLSTATITQEVVQAYVSGDSGAWFNLPAGPVGFAAGAEWREETSESNPAEEDMAGLTFGNVSLPTSGDYHVTETFFELDVPLLADLPAIEALNVDGAVRFSDYSTTGSATTWKVGLMWQPIEDVVLRGTLAEATRAPNIGELFDPGGQTFQFIDDPCALSEIDNGSEFRAPNCAALLTGLGVDPTTYTDPNTASISGTLTGNPDLDEEQVDTQTIGIVLRPRFAENLTISVDWYDIELENAINTAFPEEAAEICVDLPTLDNDFCELQTREPGSGAIVDFVQRPLNVAAFTTEGFDFTIEYLLDPQSWGFGREVGLFNFRLVGNKLEELTFVNLPDADPDEDLGEMEAPEWQVNLDLTWQYRSLLVNYGLSYFDETHRYTLDVREANPDIAESRYFDYDEHLVHDLHVAYDFGETFRLFGGVNNLTDEEPDIGSTHYPVSAIGRFFYLGLDVNLAGN